MLLFYLVPLPFLAAKDDSLSKSFNYKSFRHTMLRDGRWRKSTDGKFKAVIYFAKSDNTKQLKTGMEVEKIADNNSSFLVTRNRPFQEYLVVTPTKSLLRLCEQEPAKVFEGGKLICTEKALNQLDYSLLLAAS